MGNKGSQSQQQQTYAPNPQTVGYINSALGRAQTAAGAPFQQPVAPVAGFSPQQYQAFDEIGNAQGTAQPYMQAAGNLFGQSAQAPNISQFFNPFAGAVGSQMGNLFGQQMSQTTGQLTNAAGGVGADRIAVGQGNLANQQGLAAGQTFANLYAPSLQAAQQEQNIQQGAAYGLGALGPAAQNAQFQGAQQLLGAGGLQQQLAQAQMNAPYQNQLAQLAYPFQTSQFLGSMTGALAPGLGGTTYGTNTQPGPSGLSQAIGAGAVGAGALGYANSQGAFGANGIFGNNFSQTGNPYASGSGGYSGAGPFMPYGGVPTSARGGRIGYGGGGRANPYAFAFDDGGNVPLVPFQPDNYARMNELQELRQDAGGMGGADNLPSDVPSPQPINSGPQSVVPQMQNVAIQPHIPQLSQSGGGGGGGGILGPLGTIAGAIYGGPAGGTIGGAAGSFLDKETGLARGGRINPYMFAAGGPPDPAGVDDPDSPYNQDVLAGTADVDARLQTGSGGYGAGSPWSPTNPALDADAQLPPHAMAFVGQPSPVASAPSPSMRTATPDSSGTPFVPSPSTAPRQRQQGFGDSPWAALAAAGLGMLGGTSPFAGVNIGQGGMQGLKMLETQRANQQKDLTIEQAAKRLDDEVAFHRGQLGLERDKLNMPKEVPMGGTLVDPHSGKPIYTNAMQLDPTTIEIGARRLLNGDTTPITMAGSGPMGVSIRQAYTKAATDILTHEFHLTPEQAAAQLSTKMQEFHAQGMGMGAAERALGTQEVKMGTAGFEALGAINLARDIITKVPRTDYLPLNKLIQGYQEQTLNGNQAELHTRIQGIVNTYAAVMARGASVTTDAARTRSEELLNSASNPAVLNRVMDTMESEINMALNSPQQMREFFRKRYGQGAVQQQLGSAVGAGPAGAGTTTPTAPGPRRYDAQGNPIP